MSSVIHDEYSTAYIWLLHLRQARLHEFCAGIHQILAQIWAKSLFCGLLELRCHDHQIDTVELIDKPLWTWSRKRPPQPESIAAPIITKSTDIATDNDNA